jgi:hypothetical protein
MEHKQAMAEERPPLSPEQFRETPEFRKFTGIMRRLLKIPKSELDERVEAAKAASPRIGNPKAPGRKSRSRRLTP